MTQKHIVVEYLRTFLQLRPATHEWRSKSAPALSTPTQKTFAEAAAEAEADKLNKDYLQSLQPHRASKAQEGACLPTHSNEATHKAEKSKEEKSQESTLSNLASSSRLFDAPPNEARLGTKSKCPYTSAHVEATLMIANVPRRRGEETLHEAIRSSGYEGTYHMYLPRERSHKKKCESNKPYAFVSFTTQLDAERFVMVFHGFQFPGSSKAFEVKQADFLQMRT